MDTSTIIGLALGFVAIFGSTILEGGSPASLIAIPAALIVFGGTFATAFISFPMKQVMGLTKSLPKAFRDTHEDPDEMVTQFVRMAEQARRDGLLSLEDSAQASRDEFMRKGLLLMIDGTDPERLRAILEADIESLSARHEHSYGILEAMGGYSPTMGIIGTVIGLINVLGNLSDPSALGVHIASAFIATFYGVFTANIVWLPLAHKLKNKSKHEQYVRGLIVEGILSVQAGENPRIVQEKLESYLSPGLRGKPRTSSAQAAAASVEDAEERQAA